jgi:hypothetical protein
VAVVLEYGQERPSDRQVVFHHQDFHGASLTAGAGRWGGAGGANLQAFFTRCAPGAHAAHTEGYRQSGAACKGHSVAGN